MKVLLGLIALIILAFSFMPESSAYKRSDKQKLIEEKFKSAHEKVALDALWTDDKVFKVAVRDDGSNRDGYANYVCEVLIGSGYSSVQVQIIDVVKLNNNNKWVKLGTARCK